MEGLEGEEIGGVRVKPGREFLGVGVVKEGFSAEPFEGVSCILLWVMVFKVGKGGQGEGELKR